MAMEHTKRRVLSKSVSEHDEQCVVVRWFELCHPSLSGLLFAIPNGQHLAGSPAQRAAKIARAKREGFRNGVSDLMLPVACHGFHGLFVEMKSLSGRATVEQLIFGERVTQQGYMFAVCKGADAAIETIASYLEVV